MLKSSKHVFWQAFFVAVLIFAMGLVFGMFIEQARIDQINSLFYQSENSLYDAIALQNIVSKGDFDCNDMIDAHIKFADRIYEESILLDEYESRTELSDSIEEIHSKYDLLRTILWVNLIDMKSTCPEVNTVVYLYQFTSEDIDVRSKQLVWSRVLYDFKQLQGDNILLIPMAADNNITSLNYLVEEYDVESLPAVVINEKTKLYDHKTVEELSSYLSLSSVEEYD